METNNNNSASSFLKKNLGDSKNSQEQVFGIKHKIQAQKPRQEKLSSVASDNNTPTNPLARNKTILSWKATSFVSTPKSKIWYIIVFITLVSLVALGLFSDNFPLAILAILIGLILYLFEKKEAQSFNFSVTTEGVIAQDRLYKFSSLENFWIFYEPGGKKDLSLKSAKSFIPYINIPLGDVDPAILRKVLISFLPEVEHEDSLIDSLEVLF